jgi:HK97 family phage prohead protease
MGAIKKAFGISKSGELVVLSDSNIDTAGDIVDQDGWQLDEFIANPVMFYGHSWDVPIGVWQDVEVAGGRLVGRPVFADVEGHAQAQLIKRLWEADVLRTVSVSFMPIRYEPRKEGGTHYHEQKLLEVSIVPIPANSSAHKLALKSLGLVEKDSPDELTQLQERVAALESYVNALNVPKPEQAEVREEPTQLESHSEPGLIIQIGE